VARGYRRTIIIEFDATQVKKGADNINAYMKNLDSEFRKSAAELERFGTAGQKLALQKDYLTQKIETQKKRVAELQEQYEDKKNTLGEYDKSTQKTKASLLNAETALIKLENRLGDTEDAIRKNQGAFGSAVASIEEFREAAERAGVDLDRLANTFMGIGAVMVGVGVASAKMYMDFDAEMRKVRSTTGITGEQFKELESIVLDTARTYGIAAADSAAAAQYMAWDWENFGDKMDNAARLAIAGVTDMGTAAGVLEAFTASYNLSIDEQIALTDKLVVAQQRGNMSIGDLGRSIGQVSSIAAEANVSIDEMLAILSTSTNTLVPPATAISNLRQVISSIIKPTADASKAAEEMGIEFNAQALEARGLAGVLDDVRRATGGNTAEMARLFGSVTALSQVMAVTGSDYEYFGETLELIAGASGEAARMIEDMQTPTKNFHDSMNSLKITLIEAGGQFAPIINGVAGFINMIASASPGTIGFITTLGGLLLALGAITKAIFALRKVQEAYLIIKALVTKATGAQMVADNKAAIASGKYTAAQLKNKLMSGKLHKAYALQAVKSGLLTGADLKAAVAAGKLSHARAVGIAQAGRLKLKTKALTGATVGQSKANKVLAASNTKLSKTYGIVAKGAKVISAGKLKLSISSKALIPVLTVVGGIVALIAGLMGLGNSNRGASEFEQSIARIRKSANNVTGTVNSLPLAAAARGTNYHKGGRILVGEEGPEIVNLPQRSQVYTAARTNQLLSGMGDGTSGNVYHFYMNVDMDEVDEVYKLVEVFSNFAHSRNVHLGVSL